MKRHFTAAGVLMALGSLATAGIAVQAENRTTIAKLDTIPAADKKFAKEAAQGGMAEVELGTLAAKQGSSQKVKDFGQKMVEDHGKANEDLKSVATAKGLTLPTEPNAEQKATLARLTKLHGAAFDAAYIKAMKMDHKMDIAAFKKESTSGKDTEIKGFAARTLPVVESHYRMLMNM